VQCIVMILFRAIQLSSSLIDKDVKIRQKFHEPQLFDERLKGIIPSHLERSTRRFLRQRSAGEMNIFLGDAFQEHGPDASAACEMVSFLAPLC